MGLPSDAPLPCRTWHKSELPRSSRACKMRTPSIRSTMAQLQPPRSRLTTRRKRTSSDADASQIDAEQSRRIRTRCPACKPRWTKWMGETRDRELLMQAARRNVDATLQDMEARFYANTGRAHLLYRRAGMRTPRSGLDKRLMPPNWPPRKAIALTSAVNGT